MLQLSAKYKRGYLLLNIFLICMVISSLLIVILKSIELSKERYQKSISDLEVKCLIEGKAMSIASSVNVKNKKDLGVISDSPYVYKIEQVEGTLYQIWLYYETRPDLVYTQTFTSNFTGATYDYTIVSEGYVDGI